MKSPILILLLILIIININCDFHEFDDNFGYMENSNYINIISISYELTYNDFSVVKVIIKTYNEIIKDINFIAYLKSVEGEKKYILNCSNTYYDTIECFSQKNIVFNTEDKYYFYYEKGKSGKIFFDERDTLEDDKRISLVFKPEIIDNQKLYKDKRKLFVKIDHEIIGGGYLYIVRKSKKILHKPKDGFNKYIELNNFISHAGLYGYRPQSTLIAFKEAIRRGFHIVDADIVFSKDKVPVICHGTSLEANSNGKGKINSKTLEELKELDFGSIFNKKYKGEKILTFEELLELCKNNNVIIDLDLAHLSLKEYFINTDEYVKIIINLIKKYDMQDSIIFNENRPEAICKLKEIKKDVSISLSGMNEKANIEKMKDEYKDSKRLIYNMGGLLERKKINEDAVEYALSLGKKVKASKVDDLKFAEKLQSWGVNYITTNYLHPFLMKNDKEDPIIVRCIPSPDDEHESECEIDDEIKLIDNEIYNIYYSDNIYNISEDINDEPIGEFEYIDTNILDELYYSIINFNYDKGIIHLNTSKKLKKGKEIKGIIGPDYDNVAECYQYNFVCRGNNSYSVKCQIIKDDDKVEFNGNYTIYSLEGYSLNAEQIDKKLNMKKRMEKIRISVLVIGFLIIIILIIIYVIKLKKKDSLRSMQIIENSYLSDNALFK